MNGLWPDQSRYLPASNVRLLRLGGRSLLFSERAQKLFELNEAADAVWDVLLAQSTPSGAQAALVEMGVDEDVAAEFVESQLGAWLRDAYWTPADSPPADASPDEPRRLNFGVEQLDVEISCPDERLCERLEEVFAQFPHRISTAPLKLSVIPWANGFHIYAGDEFWGSVAEDEVAPRIKAILTEALIGRPCDGFYIHGAMLTRAGRALVLSGSPGAGKSTLTLALAARGYGFLGDDIIRVNGSGLFKGIPFAPALKPGSWPLLGPYYAELEAWPIERRGDGKKVRYAPIPAAAPTSREPGYFIALARQEGRPAEMVELNPVEALSIMLGEAYAAEGRLAAEHLARLAERIRFMGCRRLYYSDLEGAVREIGRLDSV